VLGDGKAAWSGGQGEGGLQGGGTDPRLVQVGAADPGGSERGGQGQLVEDTVGQLMPTQSRAVAIRSVIPASRVISPKFFGPRRQHSPGVVHGGFEAQDIFAFVVYL
jgi:hypothetical protein